VVELMGMTDRQFDTHNKTLLRLYEKIQKEIEEISNGKKSETLEDLIKDTKESLNRP
jgi:predicted house-cleaning noncanonical NTP pyrophosphatase (MazG superfamily)